MVVQSLDVKVILLIELLIIADKAGKRLIIMVFITEREALLVATIVTGEL